MAAIELEGYAEIDRTRHDLSEESKMLIRRGVQHKVVTPTRLLDD